MRVSLVCSVFVFFFVFCYGFYMSVTKMRSIERGVHNTLTTIQIQRNVHFINAHGRYWWHRMQSSNQRRSAQSTHTRPEHITITQFYVNIYFCLFVLLHESRYAKKAQILLAAPQHWKITKRSKTQKKPSILYYTKNVQQCMTSQEIIHLNVVYESKDRNKIVLTLLVPVALSSCSTSICTATAIDSTSGMRDRVLH